jgi:hypothetical protein
MNSPELGAQFASHPQCLVSQHKSMVGPFLLPSRGVTPVCRGKGTKWSP